MGHIIIYGMMTIIVNVLLAAVAVDMIDITSIIITKTTVTVHHQKLCTHHTATIIIDSN